MLRASGLSSTVNQQQIALPQRPRLPEDLIQVWFNQRLLVLLGGTSDVALRGTAVTRLLPRLLPLLNGRRTTQEIVGMLSDVAEKVVLDALLLLYMQGVLEDGQIDVALPADAVRQFRSQLSFYSRYVDFTRANRNRYEVLAKLRESSVLLVGEGAALPLLVGLLADLGLGQLTLAAAGAPPQLPQTPFMSVHQLDLDAARTEIAQHQLVLLVTDADQPELARRWNAHAVGAGVPLLRCVLSTNGTAAVGPMVFPGESACLECLALADALKVVESEPDVTLRGAALQLAAPQVALAVLSCLTLLVPAGIGHQVLRLNTDTLLFESSLTQRLLGCPVCSPAPQYGARRDLAVGQAHNENLPLLYHINSFDRQYLLFPKSFQDHYTSSNAKMVVGSFKSYSNLVQVPLPAPAALPAEPYAAVALDPAASLRPAAALQLSELTALVMQVAGQREVRGNPQGLRATPAAGSLNSQTIYLVALDVAGLEPGLYYVNPHTSALTVLRRGDLWAELCAAVPECAELPARPAATLVQTAAYGRLEAKYPYKAYQYSFYDSGCMLVSLEVAAHQLGYELWSSLDFYDDQLMQLLRLTSPTEFPAYVAHLLAPTLREDA